MRDIKYTCYDCKHINYHAYHRHIEGESYHSLYWCEIKNRSTEDGEDEKEMTICEKFENDNL